MVMVTYIPTIVSHSIISYKLNTVVRIIVYCNRIFKTNNRDFSFNALKSTNYSCCIPSNFSIFVSSVNIDVTRSINIIKQNVNLWSICNKVKVKQVCCVTCKSNNTTDSQSWRRVRNYIQLVVTDINISATHKPNKSAYIQWSIDVWNITFVIWSIREDRLLTFFSTQAAWIITVFIFFNSFLKSIGITCRHCEEPAIILSNQATRIQVFRDDVRWFCQIHVRIKLNICIVNICRISNITK